MGDIKITQGKKLGDRDKIIRLRMSESERAYLNKKARGHNPPVSASLLVRKALVAAKLLPPDTVI